MDSSQVMSHICTAVIKLLCSIHSLIFQTYKEYIKLCLQAIKIDWEWKMLAIDCQPVMYTTAASLLFPATIYIYGVAFLHYNN